MSPIRQLSTLKNRSWLKGLLIAMLVLTIFGCAQIQVGKNFFSRPKVISHNPPAVGQVSFSPFENQGCPKDDSGLRLCTANSVLHRLGCERIDEVNPWLGGLTPSLPMAQCLHTAHKPTQEGAYLYKEGCLMRTYVNYVIEQDGKDILIDTPEELKATFAPIESPQEALSYAVAATGHQPEFDLQFNPTYRYQTLKIEDTLIEQTQTGYRVNLFDYKFCGCGPHPLVSIDVNVSFNGDLTVGKPNPVYEDPSQDGLCVD